MKTVLITGASSGIGKATALLLAKQGYSLILTARRLDKLEKLKEDIQKKFDSEIAVLKSDVRDLSSCQDLVSKIKSLRLQVDVIINNAGLAKGFAPIHEGDFNHWNQMIDTNIKGILNITRLLSPSMVSRKSGQIINICSTAGKEVYPNGNVYCATKFAVDALTKSMRLDLYKYNIRVSQVAPGHVEETEFALTRFDGDAERAKIYEDFNPLRSIDVARTILFIIQQPEYVNIQDVVMTGTNQANSTNVKRTGRLF